MVAASALPAIADSFRGERFHNLDGCFDFNCGNRHEIDGFGGCFDFNCGVVPFFTFFDEDEFENCPFLGDTTGIVNELDCFD